MLVESNQYGASYVWGGPDDTDAPTIAGLAPRTAQIEYTPEVDDKAVDAEGHAEGNVVSKPANRMASGTFTGYVSDESDLSSTADFTWDSRFWIIKSININRDKGKYAEGTVKAESYIGITGPA
jgi:hypothetical protein